MFLQDTERNYDTMRRKLETCMHKHSVTNDNYNYKETWKFSLASKGARNYFSIKPSR